jgi:predicted esterase
MASGELSDIAEAQRETLGKSQIPHSRPEPLQIIAESSHHPERIFSRSPTLSSLPENGVSSLASGQINSTDFARSGRQYTDSTTSTSENSFGRNSNRSSIAPQLSQPLSLHFNSSEQLLQAKAAIQRESAVFEALRSELRAIPSPHQNRSPQMPVDDDLKDIRELREGLSWKIGLYGQDASKDTVNNIIVVLHDYGGDHSSVKPMVKKHFADPQTALICLGGIHRLRPTSGQVGGLYWTDEPNGNSYHRAVRLILEQVIGKVLIEKCNFPPSNIALLGHGQGGSVSLAIAAVWETTRLGGVITIDGPLPEYMIPSTTPRIPTPVLMVGGRLGALTPQAEQKAKDLFLHVDVDLRPGVDMLSIAQLEASNGDFDEIKTAKDFLAHSLRQEEWETQTVLTFGKSVKVY